MEDKKKNESQLSLSKERKLARKKEIVQMKRNALISKLVTIGIVSLVCIGLATLIGYKVYRNMTKVTPSSDYSAYLSDNGFIEGVTATDYVTIADYKNIKVPIAEVEYTDEQMNEDIKATLAEKATLDKETDAAIADGDKVSIDFVGTIDGEAFEGGEATGYDLTIGSGDFIEGFEQQLIGHTIGETVTVDVTFPEEYPDSPSLAGKDASFEVLINGIYVTPELPDEFVKENLSDLATTAEEYKNHLKTTNYDENLTTWLEDYLTENATVSSYPEDYTDHLKSIQKQMELDTYESTNAYYNELLGYQAFESFEKYVDMTEVEYDKSLVESSKETAKATLVYQAILESENITVTPDDYKAYLEKQGDTTTDYDAIVATYGQGFVLQQMVKIKALEQVKTYVTVE